MDEENIQPIGEHLDQIGILGDLREGDQITDAIVIFKTASLEDGGSRLGVAISAGTDTITRRGMMSLAEEYENVATFSGALGDDEEDEEWP